MDKAQLKQKIQDALNGMSENERIEIYNDGCEYFNCTDNMIFPMCEFDELEGDRPFLEIYVDIATDDFNVYDDYYYQDVYGWYHSFDNIEDTEFDNVFDDLIDSAINEEYDFKNPKIAEVYEEAENEE